MTEDNRFPPTPGLAKAVDRLGKAYDWAEAKNKERVGSTVEEEVIVIKMSAYNEETKTELIVLGLSDGNLKRLREGKPIHIHGAEWGQPFDIVIFWGKTEAVMAKMIEPYIGPNTVVRDRTKEKRQ